MTEAEALDEAAKAAGWRDWKTLQLIARPDKQDDIRRHAKTLMENAALKVENEALEARVAGLTHERDFHRETADLHADRIEALEAEIERLREAMAAMHKDLLLRAEIDIRDGTKIVHASNGVWLKFCAALKEIDNGDR